MANPAALAEGKICLQVTAGGPALLERNPSIVPEAETSLEV
jgi:hypothetical protein